MKLTDTTANALTTTSFLGAVTAAAIHDELKQLKQVTYTPFENEP